MKKALEKSVLLRESPEAFDYSNAIISFDACVLLDVYRIGIPQRDRFFKAIKRDSEKIKIVEQAIIEFGNRRDVVIAQQMRLCNKIKGVIDKSNKEMDTSIRDNFNKKRELPHDSENDYKNVVAALDTMKRNISSQMEELAKEYKNADILSTLNSFLQDKVLDSYIFDGEEQKKAEEKLKNKAAPGYKDYEEDDKKFGDYIIWKQLLKECKAEQKSLIFVTQGTKEDYWELLGDLRTGPRKYLRQEFRDEVPGKSLYFLELEKYLQLSEKIARGDASFTFDDLYNWDDFKILKVEEERSAPAVKAKNPPQSETKASAKSELKAEKEGAV